MSYIGWFAKKNKSELSFMSSNKLSATLYVAFYRCGGGGGEDSKNWETSMLSLYVIGRKWFIKNIGFYHFDK